MPSVSLLNIKAQALALADLVDDSETCPIAEATLNYWVNMEYQDLYMLLAEADPSYFLVTCDITLDTDEQSYLLPTDFYKVLKVYLIDSESNLSQLSPWNYDNLPLLSNVSVADNDYLQWRILRNKIHLSNLPTSAETLRLYYIPTAQELINNNDVIDLNIPVAWQDYMVNSVAARCVQKLDLDGTPYLLRKAEILNKIKVMSSTRDIGNSIDMVDVYRGL